MNKLVLDAQHFELLSAGESAYKQGQWQAGHACAEQVIAIAPGNSLAWLLKARCLVRLSQWTDARGAFAETLRLDLQNYTAWLEAGHLCRLMGELVQAAASYQHAMDVDPKRYEAYLSMARVMVQQGRIDLSQRAYSDAVSAATSQGSHTVRQVHWWMGRYALEMGHPKDALICFDSALKSTIEADRLARTNLNAEIEIDAAQAYFQLGEHGVAMHLLKLAGEATQEAILTRLSVLYFTQNLWEEAIEISRRCVAMFPDSGLAHWNLANLLSKCWFMDEAEQVLQRAEALAPMPQAAFLRASTASKTGDVEKSLDLYLTQAKLEGVGSSHASCAAMSSLYSDALSAQQVTDLHRELFATWGEGARTRESFVRAPLLGRRVKLGIVTADLYRQHPVNIFMQPVFRELDVSQFEVFVYYVSEVHDEQTSLARSRVEHWVEAVVFNDAQLAKRIESDQIDVLLDTGGHTNSQRISLFAKRAAPVQVTYLGYPGSTGVPNMDFILGDEVVTPVGHESLYTEQILRLPGTVFCFAPEENYPYPVFDQKTAERLLTFGSFNNAPKLTTHTLQLWVRVLEAVPASRLVLKAPSFGDEAAKRIFIKRLQNLGCDLTRVEFRGPVGLAEMMAEYADIDIALDPIPYNGGTTSLQAMWMGVPVLTQMGTHFVSRMGASFMTAAGLSDWIAKNDDDYVAIAKKMASDRNALLVVKQGLRKRLQNAKSWDVRAHTRAFENLLRQCL